MNEDERRKAIYRRAGYSAEQMRAAPRYVSEQALDWMVGLVLDGRDLDTELAMLLSGDGGNA